LTVWGGII